MTAIYFFLNETYYNIIIWFLYLHEGRYMIKQRTIKKAISVTGVGLHTGKKVKMTLIPAPSNTGIVYRRVDLNPIVDFFPSPETVKGTQLCTQIFDNSGKYSINTVEHINAALSACGIDNLIIEVDNIEIPIADGSSIMFVLLIQEAGIEELNADKEFLMVKKPFRVDLGDKFVSVEPYNGLYLDFTIDFSHPFISKTKNNWKGEITTQSFIENIARARTFGFLKDIEYLQANGMCLGGSLDCAMVLDDYKLINPEGLRFPDEFVRHKVLDSVGDLFVVGKNVLANYKAYKSGHELNNLALQQMLLSKNSELVTFKDQTEINNVFKYDLSQSLINIGNLAF